MGTRILYLSEQQGRQKGEKRGKKAVENRKFKK